MNTRIEYLYRDDGNYKKYYSFVLNGEIMLEQLTQYLHEGSYFIPSQIGLPDLQTSPLSVHDHIWHELDIVEPTTESATVSISAEAFKAAFASANANSWNEYEVFKQKGLR